LGEPHTFGNWKKSGGSTTGYQRHRVKKTTIALVVKGLNGEERSPNHFGVASRTEKNGTGVFTTGKKLQGKNQYLEEKGNVVLKNCRAIS